MAEPQDQPSARERIFQAYTYLNQSRDGWRPMSEDAPDLEGESIWVSTRGDAMLKFDFAGGLINAFSSIDDLYLLNTLVDDLYAHAPMHERHSTAYPMAQPARVDGDWVHIYLDAQAERGRLYIMPGR